MRTIVWAFFSRRLRLWLLLTVGAPVLAWLLGKVADSMDSRRGETRLSRALRGGQSRLERRRRYRR